MSFHHSEALGSVRESADEPRVLVGVAVPYGVVSERTELEPGGPIVREAYVPASFRDSVSHWMTRKDGGRMAYRPAHREKPVGTVTLLEDTPAGVSFRASIFESPAGDDYLAQVRAGLNGVSIEASFDEPPRAMRDGTVLHRKAKLQAIAGSTHPAYDGARIALRDMEDPVKCQHCSADLVAGVAHTCPTSPATTPPASTAPPAAPGERDVTLPSADALLAARGAAESATTEAIAPRRSPIVINRDALIYGREAASLADGRPAQFLSDGWMASQGDSDARERQWRFEQASGELARQIERDAVLSFRAGDVLPSEIPGAYPNDYIPGLLTPAIVKGRPMGGFYNRFPISDALPKIFPKVTTSTSVAVQAAVGTNPAASDFATTAVTATPLLYGAETVVARQVLDGSSPAAEAMIMADMYEQYAQASEAVVATAVEAGATASGTAITAATPYAGTQANVVKFATTRFNAAGGQFVPSALFAVLAAQADTTGRPLLPMLGPTNSDGTIAPGGLGYSLLGAQGFMSYASTANVVVTGRRSDYVIFESSIARFSYDAVTGPAGVRIGLWAYLVVGARLGSLKVTAA